MVILAGEGC